MLDKRPDYKKIVEDIKKLWFEKKKNVFEFDIKKGGKMYIIDSPPPFTSGNAHMGHALEWIRMDFIARYKRLEGYNVYFPLGYDCHGLPTELKVIGKGYKRENVAEFLKASTEFTLESAENMKETFLRIGASHDLSKIYMTIDKLYNAVTQYTLIKMFNEGILERKKKPIMWCPKCLTTISMQEAGYIEKKGKLVYIKLRIKDSDDHLLIATTRPELINSCVAVLIKDEKYVKSGNLIVSKVFAEKNNLKIDREIDYKELISKKVIVPLIEREVPIISDPEVEYEFGTGIVWVCTYGDLSDARWREKYNLPEIISISEDGRIVYDNSPINGLKIEEAREKIIEILKEKGYIERVEEIVHNILAHTERASCLSPLEFIPKDQFFINITKFKEKIKEWQEKIEIIPEYYRQRLIDWINSIDMDWNISRSKMVWGLYFPFIKVKDKIVPVDIEDLPVDFRIDKEKLEKYKRKYGNIETFDNETLDPWVESSLTPLIIIIYSLVDKDNFDPKDIPKVFEEAIKYLPVDLRSQGYEIIRTWLFYTIYRINVLTGRNPWKKALIHGMVLDEKGRKMSKSLGNVVDPNDVMDKYSPDALRYWGLMAAHDDYSFTWKDVETGQNYMIKIWNIARYLSMNNVIDKNINNIPEKFEEDDINILKRLKEVINISKRFAEEFNFQEYTKIWKTFVWEDFANKYLENTKDRVRNNDISSKWTLNFVFLSILFYLHPEFPYITEYLYKELYKSDKIICESRFEDIERILNNVLSRIK